MRYLLDTNLIIDFVGGCAPAVEAFEMAIKSEWIGYFAITRLELFGYPDLTSEEEGALTTVLEELEQVDVTGAVVDLAIKIRKSTRIKVPDAIIAATAQNLEAALITRNSDDFKNVNDLTIINPWDSGK